MSKRESVNIESVENILNTNDEIIRKIREINDQYFFETGKRKKHLTITYGCQMN